MLGGAPGPVWTGAENLAPPPGIFFFYLSIIGLLRQYIWLLWSNNSVQRPEIYVTIPERKTIQ
jgi:hypothetical protein